MAQPSHDFPLALDAGCVLSMSVAGEGTGFVDVVEAKWGHCDKVRGVCVMHAVPAVSVALIMPHRDKTSW